MKKNFVLDTNVLLHDPRSIFGFGDNDVVIPIYVIEEIDNFKRDLSTLGRNARQVSRYLDEFRAQGKLREGVSIGEGKGRIRVLMAERKLSPNVAEGHSIDDKILAVALDLLEKEPPRGSLILVPRVNPIGANQQVVLTGVESPQVGIGAAPPLTAARMVRKCMICSLSETSATIAGKAAGIQRRYEGVSGIDLGNKVVTVSSKAVQFPYGEMRKLQVAEGRYFEEADRPQTKLERDFENGMGITAGRLREDTIYDYKFVSLSHNTVRGAAGGGILIAELLKAEGYIQNK